MQNNNNQSSLSLKHQCEDSNFEGQLQRTIKGFMNSPCTKLRYFKCFSSYVGVDCFADQKQSKYSDGHNCWPIYSFEIPER